MFIVNGLLHDLFSLSDEPILVFQRNVFYQLKEERKLLSKTKGTDTMMVDQMKKVIDHLYWEV